MQSKQLPKVELVVEGFFARRVSCSGASVVSLFLVIRFTTFSEYLTILLLYIRQ